MSYSTQASGQDNDRLKVTTAVVAFEQELQNLLTKFAKKGDASGIGNLVLSRKVSFSKLFKEFKPRLQPKYYAEKLMQIGIFLCSVKAFRMAKFQCFTRYLQGIFPEFKCVEEIAMYNLEKYRQAFFSAGLHDNQAIDMIKVIFEDTMCSFQLIKDDDPKLLNSASVARCEILLKILRLTTQLALHNELLSWIVYNGTIHMYTISRHLMMAGNSAMVLEYLLWACMCMEASIPLLTLKYLPWRSTLYAAVSLCYLDCKELQHAETFARRAMKKINELSDIEDISTSVSSPETKIIFQSARVKINAIIFQRVVFELRKRPKGLLRPKARPIIKECLQQNWPRSQTERLLSDLFEGSASQFLAILQTLGGPHRRTLQCKAPTGAIDDITLDIYPELFVAGVDLISGGNTGTRGPRHEPDVHPSCLQLSSMSLLDLSQRGSDGIPIPFVIQFVKLAFSYEQWDLLAIMLQPCISLLKTSSGSELPQTPAYLMALHLMAAMEPFCNTGRKHKKGLSNSESGHQETWIVTKSSTTVDDLVVIANIIHRSSSELPKESVPYLDVDMIIDATLFLWNRCKPYFQRVVSCNNDSCRQVVNDPDCDKWLYIVLTIHNVLHWSGLSDIDPIMTGEVALKLSFVLECRAGSSSRLNIVPNLHAPSILSSEIKPTVDQKSRSKDASGMNLQEDSQESNLMKTNPVVFPNNANDLLDMAFKIIEAGVERISEARDKMEGISKMSETIKQNKTVEDNGDESASKQAETTIQIMHLELLYNLTRLLVKLDTAKKDSQTTLTSEKSKSSTASLRKQTSKEKAVEEPWIVEVMKRYNRNALTKALLLIHNTQLGNVNSKIAKQQLQECYDLIKKAQTQQKVLFSRYNNTSFDPPEPTAVPPPPILVYRNSSTIILKPAPYKPLSNEKVYWYRLFGCSASGSNVKVRLNDSDLVGTGDEIPEGPDCRFHVTNLRESERYVFAVAAYDKNGNLIGGGIGPTGYPIPASYAISVTMAWGYLTQAAYTCGAYDIAKASSQVLWKHFVPSYDVNAQENSSEQLFSYHSETNLNIIRCDEKLLANSNQALLRQFLQSIFVTVDVNIHNHKLYCDALCDYGPLLPGQVNRMKQCELMLLALQVALWLNDNTLVLQTVTRCYGLLAPVLQMKIPYKPIVKILLQCYAVLQEIPSISRFRKHTATSDSLYHLIAVITYYLTKVLPLWGEHELANSISEYGQKTLASDPPPAETDVATTTENGQPNEGQTTTTTTTEAAPTPVAGSKQTKVPEKKTKIKMGGKKKTGTVRVKPQISKSGNVQSREFLGLQRYNMRVSCDAILSQRSDVELIGTEDPIILNAYVAALSIQDSYREIMRFKRRSKFLEYFVHVIEKAFDQDNFEQLLDWSADTDNWLIRRSDQLMPMRKSSTVRVLDGHEDGKYHTKFTTAIIEYGKPPMKKNQKTARQLLETLSESRGIAVIKQENSSSSVGVNGSKNKNYKEKFQTRKPKRTVEEQSLINAIEIFQIRLPAFWRNESRRRRLRAITSEELPWRCQWSILRGLANLEIFLRNYRETKKSSFQPAPQQSFRSSCMGTDWFSFDNSGILIPRSSNVKEIPSQMKDTISTLLQNIWKMNNSRKGMKELLKMDGSNPETLRHIVIAARFLTQAVVLSSRGGCWGILQNSCSQLWNLRQKLEEVVNDPSSFVTEDVLQELTWRAFYHAADSLLDMVCVINKDKKRTVKSTSKSPPATVTFWGDIEEEKGGSDLIFEDNLDEQTFADVVWIKRVVMYSMELLFYQKKWEKLADIILRFNALSHGRYAENVLPVLAVAQEKLLERAEENGGLSSNQPEITISAETGRAVDVIITAGSYSYIDTSVHIDPRGHDVYTASNSALQLFSVPLDKSKTLEMLRQAVDQKHCAARALQHSRQLLLRYLAGLCPRRRSVSRVGFIPSDDQAVTSLPPDLSEQKFEKIEEIQKLPLASSQLGVVITSYDKTIEMLQFHGRKALLAQAMSELGNIMLHIGNTRAAYKWWQTVLDTILSPIASSKQNQQSDNNYHNAVHVAPSLLLKKRGMWGCLLGAVTATNLARYVYTNNTDQRLEYCCVAAALFRALFASSLPHPIACCDYALYDIGTGYPVGTLVPGLNLFTDSFRCDAKTLLMSLLWLTEELLKTGHYLMVLPLLTFARYIASDVFDDNTCVSRVLLLRTRALIKAGMYSQAHTVLNLLFSGTRLATKDYTTNQQDSEGFQCSKPVTDESNIQAITNLISLRLSPRVTDDYGSEQSRDVMLEQARLIIAIAFAIYAIPEDLKEQLLEKLGKSTSDISTELTKSSIESIELFEKNPPESVVKSYLLAGAELLLEEIRDGIMGTQTNLRDFLDARGQSFNLSDFQCLILIELEFANIRLQHLECLSAAQIVFYCMRALEDVSILLEQDNRRIGSAWTVFSRSSDISKTPELLRDDFIPSKTELDSHLWLTCRMKMVECLSGEDNSIGRIAGFSRTVIALTGSCEQHCEQGVDEADAFGKTEIVLQFKMTALLLRLKHGCLSERDVEELKNAIDVLKNFHPLSVNGHLMLGQMMIYYGDFISSYGGSKEDSMIYYEQAETLLQNEMAKLGVKFDKGIASPLQNTYLHHVLLVAEIKLRIGRRLTQMIDESSNDESVNKTLDVLNTGYNLATSMNAEQSSLEVEFLCLIATLQRILWLRNQCAETVVISSFYDAIKKSYDFDHDLELMKECYQQLSFFYLAKHDKVEKTKEVASTTSEGSGKTTITSKSRKEEKTKDKKGDTKSKVERKKELKAAWFAIRAVASITAAIYKRGLLLGEVTHLNISKETGSKIPKCVIHDVLGAVSIMEDPDEVQCVAENGVLTMESFINNSNKVQMTWVHLLSHASYLQRQICYQSLGVKDADHCGPSFRWEKLLKLRQVRHLLQSELEIYDMTCSGYYPSAVLFLADVTLYEKYYDPSYAGKAVDEAGEYEVAIHWLSPGSHFNEPSTTEAEHVQCLYAFNTKAVSGTSKAGIYAGTTSTPQNTLMEVHKQLQDLLELAESEKAPSTPGKAETPASQVSSGTSIQTSRRKRTAGTRSTRDEEQGRIQVSFKECLSCVTTMIKPSLGPDKKEKTFEASLANIRTLESVFDPSRGFIGKVTEKLYSWLSTIFKDS